MDGHDVLTISEVVERSGFAASALRYYESQGLIEARRSGGGQRRYERSVLRRLAFIRTTGRPSWTRSDDSVGWTCWSTTRARWDRCRCGRCRT